MTDVLAIAIIVLLVINLIGLLMVGTRVSNQSADARNLEKRLATDGRDLERRLTTLEARVENLPTHRDLLAMGKDVTEVMETIAGISGQTDAMTQMLRTIQQYLLDREKPR
jgi:hypothetical protein